MDSLSSSNQSFTLSAQHKAPLFACNEPQPESPESAVHHTARGAPPSWKITMFPARWFSGWQHFVWGEITKLRSVIKTRKHSGVQQPNKDHNKEQSSGFVHPSCPLIILSFSLSVSPYNHKYSTLVTGSVISNHMHTEMSPSAVSDHVVSFHHYCQENTTEVTREFGF